MASPPPAAGASSAPNTITMNADSDMAGLSMAQIHELNQSSVAESTPDLPFVGELLSIDVLRAEYERGNQVFVAQIDWLKANGYTKFRRTRGDGDCFYRSLAFAYVERIMTAPDICLATMTAESSLENSSKMLSDAGFEKFVWEDFYDVFVSIIHQIVAPEEGKIGSHLNHATLLEAFQNAEVSNAIVMYLRMLTSAQLCADPNEYSPYLINQDFPEVDVDIKQFCRSFIEPMGCEADNIQMVVLSRALQAPVKIAQLDGHDPSRVTFFDTEGKDPLLLLYRPGHYDILFKE